MRRVLMLTEEMIPSAILCAHAPLTELARQGKLEYRWSRPGALRRKDLSWADTVVFLRADSRWEAALSGMASDSGRDTIYVMDDDLLSVPRELSSGAFYARESTRSSIRGTMRNCRCLLSPSEELLEKYGGGFARTGRIEEPALGGGKRTRRNDGRVVIGFAGSIDRAGDIDQILEKALTGILDKYGGRVSLEFFGARPALADRPGVRHIPYQAEYSRYQETMASLRWDIALAPMPDTPFHRCKHYNKFIEYAVYGIPGIYSDVIPYRRAVRHGENGLLTENTTEAWMQALETLILDEPLRRRLAETAYKEARSKYSLAAAAALWEQALAAGEIIPDDSALSRYEPIRRRALLAETAEKIRLYGWRAPGKALKKFLGRRKGRPF